MLISLLFKNVKKVTFKLRELIFKGAYFAGKNKARRALEKVLIRKSIDY